MGSLYGCALNCYVQRDLGGSTGQCLDKQRDELFGVTAHISPCTGIQFPTMSVVSQPGDVRRGAEPDPHIVELGNLMLARAPELGGSLADRLFRDVDFYRDGSIVTKDQVRATCEANLTFVFDSLAAHTDVDVSPAQHTGTTRALAGVPLPALMTAYRIGFRFMWEETLAVARSAGIPTESILNATARVFLAQDTFTQAMADAYRQQLTAQIVEQEEERSALVEALLSRRITDTQSLWEAADLLRLPTTGTVCRRGCPAACASENWRCPRSKTSLPHVTSGRRGACCPTYTSASYRCAIPEALDTLSTCSARPLPSGSASARRFRIWPIPATRCASPDWR